MTAEGRLSRMMPSGISGLTAPSSTVKLTVLMSLLQKDSVALIIETGREDASMLAFSSFS